MAHIFTYILLLNANNREVYEEEVEEYEEEEVEAEPEPEPPKEPTPPPPPAPKKKPAKKYSYRVPLFSSEGAFFAELPLRTRMPFSAIFCHQLSCRYLVDQELHAIILIFHCQSV